MGGPRFYNSAMSAAVLQVTTGHNVQDQSPSPETNLELLFVLFHSDEGKMVFLKLKLKEEESTCRWFRRRLWDKGIMCRAWVTRTATTHTLCSIHQINSLRINTSSSLARFTFCFPLVKCKIYLKINIVVPYCTQLLLPSVCLISSLSFLESVERQFSKSTASLWGIHTILKWLLFQKD